MVGLIAALIVVFAGVFVLLFWSDRVQNFVVQSVVRLVKWFHLYEMADAVPDYDECYKCETHCLDPPEQNGVLVECPNCGAPNLR